MTVRTDVVGRFQPFHRPCSLVCQLKVVGAKRQRLPRQQRLGNRCGCPRLLVANVAEPAAVDEGAAAESTAPHSAPSLSASSGIGICEVSTLPPQLSFAAALQALSAAVQELPSGAGSACSGLIRLEVPVPRSCKALWWLRGQGEAAQTATLLHPRVYFSPRRSAAPDTEGSRRATAASAGAGSVAGAGAAWLWQGSPGGTLDDDAMSSMQRFLASGPPRMRAFGGARFNAAQAPAPEWEPFGSFYFVLPRVEFTEAAGCGLLACNVAWDVDGRANPEANGVGFSSLEAAVMDALAALSAVQPPAAPSAGALRLEHSPLRHLPDEEEWRERLDAVHPQLHAASVAAGNYGSGNACGTAQVSTVSPDAALNEYLLNGQQGLDDLLAALDGGFEAVETGRPGASLTKVVLARRTDVELSGRLDPLALLEALQERDPRAYQVALQLPTGETFVASTPECLYTRTGDAVASEAVAGTRARGAGGDVEKDFWLSFDLLRSAKDHVEFGVVRDWVQNALGGVCDEVRVEVSKSVLKQGGVQHLYGKLAARLKVGVGDAGLLAALHPTPAVCGQPRGEALELVQAQEPFDRGFYAGPFGWVSHGSAEFVVAIRSALVRPAALPAVAPSLAPAAAAASRPDSHAAAGRGPSSEAAFQQQQRRQQRRHASTSVSLYAGVGIVAGSDTASEWSELDLKVAQYVRLLRPAPPLAQAPNIAALWARLMVEELCRMGCNTFCVAPGSRSSPLTVAIAQHPRARIVPCIDERSLGFWALGHARACGRPAVVVTSSGTAVANLLPAVIEASQSNVPMLLLTADRPAEMRDTGANQTIDQVGIFGRYTRWECDVQAPTDEVPACSALTTVGAAVHRATGTPSGPVHLNCQFREPLAPAAAPWDRACLQGLQRWEDDHLPFTLTAAVPPSTAASSSAASAAVAGPHLQHDSALNAVLTAVKGAQHGLIVAAELIAPEDSLAAVQLAQALGWPLAADALSGLRAGAHAAAGPRVALLSHFDHLLLDRAHWPHLQPDVVLQLGGHLTSKRTAQFLEWCALGGASASGGSNSTDGSSSNGSTIENGSQRSSGESVHTRWVFVDRSPRRHDQGHLVTHRVQAALPALVTAVAVATGGRGGSSAPTQALYAQLLAALEGEAAAAVDAAVAGMAELTEPEVAQVVTRELPPGEGLFIGNSMPIRDVDMYSRTACTASGSASQGTVASGVGAPVGCNRGASGIDGVLSTAAGFADGLGRGCTLLVGDISFLHDINGLNLLRSGEMRPPLTVVLVNNGGGGIFSFLPIAEELPEEVFTPLWATPQHVDLAGMCRAHGIPHLKASSAEELCTALHSAWGLNRHSVIEVLTDRGTNVDRHRRVQAAVQRAVHAALSVLAPAAAAALAVTPVKGGKALCPVVSNASYRRFALPLAKPLTTSGGSGGCREGLYLRVTLQAGSRAASGEGEVSPLPGLHAETVREAEQQVAALCELMRGAAVAVTAALLGGRFACWLEQSVGVSPAALHPSVRCGLEAAVLSALAQLTGTSLAALLAAPAGSGAAPAAVVNAVLDCSGSAAEVAAQAATLVASGFVALKIKVGRRADPAADAEVVLAVRRTVGAGVVLRADANQRWTLEQAVQFGTAVSAAQLQYVEEPFADASQAAEFFRCTGIAIALDESIDQGGIDISTALPPGVSAVVLKPSSLGGFERTLQLAAWAQQQGASAVVSSAFESPLGLGQLAHLAAAIDPSAASQHGLATEGWFTAGAALPLLVEVQPSSQWSARSMGIAVDSAPKRGVAAAECSMESTTVVTERRIRVSIAAADFDFHVLQVAPSPLSSPASNGNGSRADSRPPVVFMHGFLGSADEWMPHMRALAATGRRCYALDLPGHGATLVSSADAAAYSLQAAAAAVAAALRKSGLEGCTLVGYSLGARLALLLAAQRPELAARLMSLSGTPGIQGGAARAERAAGDAALAETLRRGGLKAFVKRWYQHPMWRSLQAHPRFAELVQRREREGDAWQLSRALTAMSPGRAPAVWADLEAAAWEGSLPRLLLVAGGEDAKFVGIGKRLAASVNGRRQEAARAVVVPRCGHAVHLERPLELLSLLAEFA